jgi:hypothetical protein
MQIIIISISSGGSFNFDVIFILGYVDSLC